MGLDNVAVHWPRTGRFYDPVAPAEFVDFGDLAEAPDVSAPTAPVVTASGSGSSPAIISPHTGRAAAAPDVT